jgi:hypothetical protein
MAESRLQTYVIQRISRTREIAELVEAQSLDPEDEFSIIQAATSKFGDLTTAVVTRDVQSYILERCFTQFSFPSEQKKCNSCFFRKIYFKKQQVHNIQQYKNPSESSKQLLPTRLTSKTKHRSLFNILFHRNKIQNS